MSEALPQFVKNNVIWVIPFYWNGVYNLGILKFRIYKSRLALLINLITSLACTSDLTLYERN
jgi:hypothetical protein